MSSAAEPHGDRKLLKPLMEKRRRDRMNRSLDRLRLLLLAATCDERLRNPKVEKAEILQKTVQFLRVQPLSEPSRTEELFLRRYRSGYRECLARAARFLQAIPAETPCLGLGPTAVCPPLFTAGPADTSGPPSRHGLPTLRVGPGCSGYHSYGPGYHSFGPTPGPGLGPTHRPDCGLGYRPGDGPCCPGDGPCCPGDGPGCPGHRSRCPGCHSYGPGLGPTFGPTFGPSWGTSLGPQHGPNCSSGCGPSGHEDSRQRCAKEEAPGEGGGLLGPPHHVWRPWP
ncbi:transcription factor HES-7 [Falco cherrug]|uniref:transcription factor HES-7 n=1 Tax=Falco cherrug TaxID=345164 RepID=UPI00247A3A35|nr:transcription factor HES-7 [Falco cherrug]